MRKSTVYRRVLCLIPRMAQRDSKWRHIHITQNRRSIPRALTQRRHCRPDVGPTSFFSELVMSNLCNSRLMATWHPKRSLPGIKGINPKAILMVGDHYDHPLCPGLQPGPPSQTPGGLGQRFWSVSVVMSPPKPGVSAVGVFRAIQPNGPGVALAGPAPHPHPTYPHPTPSACSRLQEEIPSYQVILHNHTTC